MCDFFSGVIDRKGKIWTDLTNSHSSIIDLGEGKLDNLTEKQNCWEFEILPPFTNNNIPTEMKVRLQEPTKIVQRAYTYLRNQFIAWEKGERLDEIPNNWWDVKGYLVNKGIKNIAGVLYKGKFKRLPVGIEIVTGTTIVDDIYKWEQVYLVSTGGTVGNVRSGGTVGNVYK